MSFNIEETDIGERIKALGEEQQAELRNLFMRLVLVLSEPSLKGFFIHSMPSQKDAEIECVMAFSINVDLGAAEGMLRNFLDVRKMADTETVGVH